MPTVQSPLLAPAIRHYKAGRLDQAEVLLRRLVQKNQAPGEAPLMLAKVLLDQDKLDQARFEIERQLKIAPQNVELRLTLAGALGARGRYDEAFGILDEIVAGDPGNADAVSARGIMEFERGEPTLAESRFRRALELRPGDALSAVWLGHALVAQLRQGDAICFLRENLRAFPGRAAVQQILAFLVHYSSDLTPDEVLREQRLAGSLCARSADGLPPRIAVSPDPERRLTIGIISPDLRQHSCSYFIQSILEHRSREMFRFIAFDASKTSDEVTRRLKSQFDQWRPVGRADDRDVAEMIAADKVDIVIDLAGHTSGTRLPVLALRPAPVGMTYLGYPGSTGMGAATGVDYRIVDEHTDPPGSEHLATETLLRLPGCFLCYTPPTDAPDIGPPPSIATGGVTFGSFNAIAKLSAATLDLWSGVLAAVPGSRMMIKARQLGDAPVARRLRDEFARRGIDPARIEPVAWAPGIRGHLDLYNQIDIALDTTPYNGTTTTCEALWMGVPVIALAGNLHAGRVGVSLLHAAGIPELIAGSPEDYIRIAAQLAADAKRLAALRAGLRTRLKASRLLGGAAHARDFEGLLRSVWREWCAAHTRR
jgi:protein O-GlcNAc transferase